MILSGNIGVMLQNQHDALLAARKADDRRRLDEDVRGRLRSVAATLANTNEKAMAIDFRQLAHDIEAALAALPPA